MDEITRAALEARDGDPSASSQLIRLTQAEVWRLCAHLVDIQAADDLTQETYLRAFRSLRSFRAEASARTWLLSIARRTAMDELRRRSRHTTREQATTGTLADVADPADALVLEQLLGQLDADRRAAFVLTQVLGFGYREAAEICGCPVGTIRSRVARARTALIAMLPEEESRSVEGNR